MSQMTEELSAELAPPPESKSKQKRAKKDPASQKTPGKRGQPRPYRKLADDILTMRVTKLTARLERAKKQVTRILSLLSVIEWLTNFFMSCILPARGYQAPAHQVFFRENRSVTRHAGLDPQRSGWN